MAFRQVLGDRQPLRGDEQQAVTVFPFLHLVAGAKPPAPVLLKLLTLVRVEVAGAEGSPHFLQVGGQPLDDRLRHPRVGVRRRTRLRPVVLHVAPDLAYRFLGRLWPCHVLPPFLFRCWPPGGDAYIYLGKPVRASANSLSEPYLSAASFDRHFMQIASSAGGTSPLSERTGCGSSLRMRLRSPVRVGSAKGTVPVSNS